MFSHIDPDNASGTQTATVGFVDIAGFSAIADVFGDGSALAILDLFEALVDDALGDKTAPVKWIGDEAMLAFPDPATALQVLGRLLPACRAEPRLPLTRSALNHGPVVRRGGDLFGTTVNVAARITALAGPGELLATGPVAEVANAQGIAVRALGPVALRSVAAPVALFAIELAPSPSAAWIDPVCKMHAPYEAFLKQPPNGPWFCSEGCAEAYRRSPETYRADGRRGSSG
jgi:class 3 adenylate cyclase/YHS domain-containing protein